MAGEFAFRLDMTDRAEPRDFGPDELRVCMGHFATGVTVVTYRDDGGEPRGATVNSFTSVSLDPPLLLVSLARKAKACALLENRSFCVNVLASDQLPVALQFAGKPNSRLRLQWDVDGPAPHLADAMAWMECDPWRAYDGGDHVLHVGEVKRLHHEQRDPLLFCEGSFRSAGIVLFHTPQTIQLDGRPIPDWVRAADRLHDHIEAI